VLTRLVVLGRERRIVRGRRLRVDTTVVETNIHYPTDATLLADGVRVLTRSLRRIGERVRERTRSVARRVFEIAQRNRFLGAARRLGNVLLTSGRSPTTPTATSTSAQVSDRNRACARFSGHTVPALRHRGARGRRPSGSNDLSRVESASYDPSR